MLNQHIQTLLRYGGMSTTPTEKDYEADYGTPDYTITSFPSTATGVSNSDDVLIAIDANISSTNDGVLIELGGAAGAGLAVGVNNGSLRARAFSTTGGSPWGTDSNAAEAEVDISSYTGSDATYYISVDASTFTLKVYVQAGGRGSASSIVQLGTGTAGGGQTTVYGSNTKGYGEVGSSIADIGSAYEVSFNGTIDQIRYWAEDAAFDVSGFPPTPAANPANAAGFAVPSGPSTPSYVGSASASGSSSLSLTGITGLAEGDVVVACLSDDNVDVSVISSGWTTISSGDTNSIAYTFAYKVMGATPDTLITVSTAIDALTATAFRDVDYESISAVGTDSGTTFSSPPSATVTQDDSVVLMLACLDDDDSTISSPSTGYTVAAENGRVPGGSNAQMYKTGVATGTESPSSYTWSSADAQICATVVLKPSGPASRQAAGFQIPA